MTRPRITISHDEDIDPVTAMMAAGHAIAHWTKESAEGRYWSPGAIATYKNTQTGDIEIATSTKKTRSGWSVILFTQTENTHAS